MIDPQKQAFVEACEMVYGVHAEVSAKQIKEIKTQAGLTTIPYWLMLSQYQVQRGIYRCPTLSELDTDVVVSGTSTEASRDDLSHLASLFQSSEDNAPNDAPSAIADTFNDTMHTDFIPKIHYGYIPFGFFGKLKTIIESGAFFPVYITGYSGEGKTLMVEQVCSITKRECIKVSISIETDQTELVGGPTLFNGNVINREGPVITAMRRGAVLLLDEVDRGSNKLICLHSILEGKPYFNKKTGEIVYPAPGFTVVATANTKGRGSDDGRYLSQIMDEAFLERFLVTVEQENPPADLQKQMLSIVLDSKGVSDDAFVANLVRWAGLIQTSFKDEGTIDEKISTRRLVHICETYSIFKDRLLAINLCINRFDQVVKKAFLDFYRMVDETTT